MGKGLCRLVGGITHRRSLNTSDQTRCVHHGEHIAQALVLFTNQNANGVGVVHLTGGRRLDAHLLLNALAPNPIVGA